MSSQVSQKDGAESADLLRAAREERANRKAAAAQTLPEMFSPQYNPSVLELTFPPPRAFHSSTKALL